MRLMNDDQKLKMYIWLNSNIWPERPCFRNSGCGQEHDHVFTYIYIQYIDACCMAVPKRLPSTKSVQDFWTPWISVFLETKFFGQSQATMKPRNEVMFTKVPIFASLSLQSLPNENAFQKCCGVFFSFCLWFKKPHSWLKTRNIDIT